MTEVRLFTPGPTPVPREVLESGAQPMIHHRSEDFAKILESVRARLKWLCDTDGEVLCLSSSGTGGLEASVASLFAAGDEVIIVEGGKFGERWVELAELYQLQAHVIHVDWGKSVRPEEVLEAVKPSTKGIFIQACESSTGAYHPVEKIGNRLKGRGDLLFVVDAITALGVHDLSMKRDRIDVLVCASQKALMSPPGISTVALSSRAISKLETMKPRSYYLSLQRELKSQTKGATGFTPSVSLFRNLAKALEIIEKEGKEHLFWRHRKLQRMARAAFSEMGLKLFNAEEDATFGITVALPPSGLDVKTWLKVLKSQKGLWLAGGQGKLEGKIFRISHMGACEPSDLLWAINTIESSLAERLAGAKEGRGVEMAKTLQKEIQGP